MMSTRIRHLRERILRRIRRELSGHAERMRHQFLPSFAQKVPTLQRLATPRLAAWWSSSAGSLLGVSATSAAVSFLVQQQAASALSHVVDLLGSGPTQVVRGLACRGFEGVRYASLESVRADSAGEWLRGRINRTNLKASQRIWQRIETDYQPIDWQLDFISGYRWREDTWHRDIRLGHLPGVDVKLPWELARLQHLPNLALAGLLAQDQVPGFEPAEVYAREVRNQILDFISTNPPGFGVNWACAMDVGIRCANLLLALDLLKSSGVPIDETFESTCAASVLAHGRHIVKNLEWAPQYRGNHYLANIVGLLFAASYLPSSEEVNSWLLFAAQELLAEVRYQFHEDGSNFEGSVCYHRLSAEMVMWGCAVLTGLSPQQQDVLAYPGRYSFKRLPRLNATPMVAHPVPGRSDRTSVVPTWCWERLARMADFTEALTRPDGQVVQFGDNDSGRFITLLSGEQVRSGNDPSNPLWSLDHRSLVAGIRALLGKRTNIQGTDEAYARVVRGFAGLTDTDAVPVLSHQNQDEAQCCVGDDGVWHEWLLQLERTPAASRWTSRFTAASEGLRSDIQCAAFPGMGCYVWRNTRLFLAVRCGEIGVAGLGAHAHGDQLAIELVIDGVSHVRDPGTYVYTPSPARRNAYRSARAHHVPHVNGHEPVDLTLGLFDLRGAAPGECLYFGPRGFVGRHAGYGPAVVRIVVLEDAHITVHDIVDGGLTLSTSDPDPLPFSPAYGRVVAQAASPP